MSGTAASLLTAIAALGAVLGLIWLAQTVARKSKYFSSLTGAAASGPARLALVQSLALGQRRQLQLIRCDGQHFLLLSGGSQDVMLGFVPGVDQT